MKIATLAAALVVLAGQAHAQKQSSFPDIPLPLRLTDKIPILRAVPPWSGDYSNQPYQNYNVPVSSFPNFQPVGGFVVPSGCVGNGIADDTICMQAALDASAAAGLPLFLDGIHLYLISSTLTSSGIVDIEGFAPVGNDGVANAEACLSGLVSRANVNLLILTGEKVIVRNLCMDMAALGGAATGGAAILLGGADQQHDVLEGNTIFRPYDGISFGGAGGLVRDSIARSNVIRDPRHIGIPVGAGTTGGQTAGITLYDNRIGCDSGVSGNGVGVAFFDGALDLNGTTVGSNNCWINTEIIPGANQNVNGVFKGVMGDSAGAHSTNPNPTELLIQPTSATGAIQWLNFIGTWEGGDYDAATQIYIANPNGALCSNIKFVGTTVHSYRNTVTAVNLQGCNNILFSGGSIDSWPGGGATTNAMLIAEHSGQPTHIAINGMHIGYEGNVFTNGINIQTGGTPNPDYLSIVGNEFGAVTNPIVTDLSTTAQGNLWTIGPNEGIDDLIPEVASGTSIVIPGAFSTIHVTGNTNIATISPVWQNRKLTLMFDDSLSLVTGGSNPSICGASLTVPAAGMAILQYNSVGNCWMHQ